MDHPADVILHGWGMTWKEALEKSVEGLANYMIPVHDITEAQTVEMNIKGAENDSDIVFMVLDEYLFRFSTELFVAKNVSITQLDDHNVSWTCKGDKFILGTHVQGTEVKAITMHNMRIYRRPDGNKTHIFVTLDI